MEHQEDLFCDMDVEVDVANGIIQTVRRLASGGATYITGVSGGVASVVSGAKAGSLYYHSSAECPKQDFDFCYISYG